MAFGFLGMGPVTIAVDSYGPVTDNAQSVYELSLIENVPDVSNQIQKEFGFKPDFEKGKQYLEENDGAGNTFKATAKPVLIGTAVVGATTMIFSIIMVLTRGLTQGWSNLSLLHAPFLLGLITGGAIIYWFSGASMQAVATGAYRAVEFIKRNIQLDGVEKASVSRQQAGGGDLHPVRAAGDGQHLPRRLLQHPGLRLRRAVLLHRLPHLHRHLRPLPGDLHGQRRWRLGQRQEAGGDGAEGQGHRAPCGDRGRRHRRRSVQGHLQRGDEPDHQVHHPLRACWPWSWRSPSNRTTSAVLAVVFFVPRYVFVWRSFYGMRIEAIPAEVKAPVPAKAA